MQLPRVPSLLLALLLTACSGSGPGNPTDGGSGSNDGGGTSVTLATEELPAATVAQPYSATLVASGGSPAYSWHLIEGSLPAGLTLSASGEISGTPSTAGSVTFTLEVRDSAGHTARRVLGIEVRGPGFAVATPALPDAYLGSDYSAPLAVSGGTAPYTWVLAGGALPSGVRLAVNGRISGTPVAPGIFSFTLGVQDASGLSAQRDFTLSVFAPPSLSDTPLALAVVGAPYSASLNATGGRGPLSLRVSAGSLPAGLRLEGSSILGTPTAAGTASFTLQVQDLNGRSASASFQLTVRNGLTVTSTTLPDAYTDAAYGHGLSAAGGKPPYTWALTAGTLPAGLQLLDSGALDGTSSAPGTSSFTVRATDAEGGTDTREVSLTTYTPPTLAAVAAQSAYVNDSIALPFSASGGKAPYLFSTSGVLPQGLTLAAEGLLHGRPGQAGTFTFDVTARDANGRAASRSISFTVHAPPAITTTALPDGDTGKPYSTRLSASGGRGALSWTHVSGSLPSGLALASDGTVSGTPSSAGSSTFTARVTDEGGRTDSRTLSLAVYSPPTVTTASLSDGYVGESYTASLTATGGRVPYSWSIDSGALPQGLSFTASSGTISGAPGAAVAPSVTVRVTDSGGRTSTRTLSLAVYRPPSLSGPSLQLDGYVSEAFSVTYSVTDGKPPYTFFTPGTLPAWLSLSSSGQLSGTPPSEGSTSGQVIVSDANGRTHSRAFALTVRPRPIITSLQLPETRLGESYSTSLQSSGGKAPMSWSLTSGSLPPGLSLSSSGLISGTSTGGTRSFTARVTDINGRFAERPLTLPVYISPRVTTASLPDGVVGQSYSATLTASDGRAPLMWSHTGSLPAGLELSTSGVLSGTPTAAGTASFTVFVQDAEGIEDSRALSLTVRAGGIPLTVGHWNIEWFGAPNQGPPSSSSDGGTSDDLQIAHASNILGDAGVNLWGLVEMVDSEDFATLKAQLPGYSGFLANDESFVLGGSSWYSIGEQKPGILYDSSLTFQGAQLILTSQSADFAGRPPLRVDFTISGLDEPLVVIVLHMKAFADQVSYGQRQRAGSALKSYLDSLLPTERVLVIGDWNDDVDRSITRDDFGAYLASPFEPFVLDTPNYTFITRPLSLGGERTTTGYPDAIDHTLATNELAVEYVPGSVRVLRPDAWISNYANVVSDHYPVISRYALGGEPGVSSPSHLFINEVLANEPSMPDGGVDNHYEFIEVVNAGTSSADLSGWMLWDSALLRHVFPSGTSLAPGRAFVVYGGPRGFPAGTPDTQAASTGQLGLNNDGDSPSLRAPDGGIVDSLSYTSTVDNVSINRMPDAAPDAGFVLHTTLNPGLGSSAGRRADGGSF
ncbi:putative Ig domain-containing protein [Myxococcus sp. RHSTA-1-4]|uniref:putative Ig domain-containing protein n=1 Tax=Myxococcus sp. RHSTA-1-4 TaxID=2874601 RepID=UPI001CBD3D1F|nr:putative Ig domain-containing protein [Myxococcus sp. RHSTA-1-4]MBZ4421375.1 putative Ig domain-containing protein [Myxococcus sp. RHSTA-1-4]